MYITKIKLENIRRYYNTSLDLSFGRSVLICGNNGSGKSSFLRSIAMGVCDQASSGALLRDLRGDFIRKNPEPKSARQGRINIQLAASADTKYAITTTIKTKADAIFETVDTTTEKNDESILAADFPWKNVFITGYGPGLRTEGSEDYVQYFPADAVYSIFEYTYPLQSPELTWRRFIDAARDSVNEENADEAEKAANILISKELKKILALDESEDEISLENNGIFVKSSWGKQELSALGDGYRSLIILILDILSWNLLFKNHDLILKNYENNDDSEIWQPITDFKSIEGIVIIDEIEKHLHPKLQHNIISHLKEVFPKVQFIISTHSPLCVSGVADVENDFSIYCTYPDIQNDGAIILKKMDAPKGLTADDIYRIYFEIGDTRNIDMRRKFERYDALYLKSDKNEKEMEDLKKLEAELSEYTSAFIDEKRLKIDKNIDQNLAAILTELKKKSDKN